MKCSQVTHQVFCRFYFQNTVDEDYYILEYNTPLEGLRYPYFTISQGDKVIEYQGIHVSRMAPTKDSYVLIEAGKTITSPVVDLTSSYKFDSDGIYTIEYTKPFVYISDAEMSMIDDDKNLPQATGYDDLVASTEIELRDAYYLKPTDNEVEMANMEFNRKTSLDDVYISTSCRQINFVKSHLPNDFNTDQLESDIMELHTKLCEIAYPAAIEDAKSNDKKAPYTTFFGSRANKETVISVLEKVTNGLLANEDWMHYVFRDPNCGPKDYAYAVDNKYNVHLCILFENAPMYSIIKSYHNSNYDSKFQTLAHEYTHIFAGTDDIRYGYYKCSSLIFAENAVKNADSYGYYVQNVYDARPRDTVGTEK